MRFLLIPSCLVLSLTISACDHHYTNATAGTNTSESPELLADSTGDRVTLNGKVVSATPNSFILDYGGGRITVERNNWGPLLADALIRPGDRVIVTGRVGGGFFTKRSIEARSVYDQTLNTAFFTNGADQENFGLAALRFVPGVAPDTIDYTGWVTGVNGRRFTLGSGATRFTVDTSSMSYDPLGGEGYQKIRTGQRVYVWGDLSFPAKGNPTLAARGVVTLLPNALPAKQGAKASPGPAVNATSPSADAPTSTSTPANAM